MTRIGLYCPTCMRFIRYGREAGPAGGDLEWLPESCDWCSRRERKRLVEIARLEAMWAAKTCAAEDCHVVFTPSATHQRFCSDACRKRSHARAKARR